MRTYVSPELRGRLNTLVHYSNPQVHMYAIGSLPQQLHWGAASGGADDLSSYVTFQGVPVKVWFPAEVKVPWFFDDEGAILKKASICFKPIRQVDYDRAVIILTTFANPPTGMCPPSRVSSCSPY